MLLVIIMIIHTMFLSQKQNKKTHSYQHAMYWKLILVSLFSSEIYGIMGIVAGCFTPNFIMRDNHASFVLFQNDWTALHVTAWNGYADLCRALLAAHASVNLLGAGGSSALSLACQQGHGEIVSLLITAECNVNQTAHLGDSHNVTPLHLAAQNGHAEIVKLLVQSGAVVNATMTVRGIQGVTPLHLAVQSEHLDVMDILIEAGCNVHSSTKPDPEDVRNVAMANESVC